jgi:hypothetical protein
MVDLDADAHQYRLDEIKQLKQRIKQLEKALRACHNSLNVAFDYDGNVFGIHHNAAVDADIMTKRVLEKVDWRITDDDR